MPAPVASSKSVSGQKCTIFRQFFSAKLFFKNSDIFRQFFSAKLFFKYPDTCLTLQRLVREAAPAKPVDEARIRSRLQSL
jgi:hypothetical protein